MTSLVATDNTREQSDNAGMLQQLDTHLLQRRRERVYAHVSHGRLQVRLQRELRWWMVLLSLHVSFTLHVTGLQLVWQWQPIETSYFIWIRLFRILFR